MRGEQWWHDPGVACGAQWAEFSPVPPFDPIGQSWSVSDPQALLDDLPGMTGPVQQSAARELLRRYPQPLAEVGAIDVRTLLDYSRRAASGEVDDDGPLSFTDPVVSSDYAPGNDASDVGEERDPWDDEPPAELVQRSSGRRPRTTVTAPEQPSSPVEDDDEWEDEGPAPLTL